MYTKKSKDQFIQVCRPSRMLRFTCLQKTRLVAHIFYLHSTRGSWCLLLDANLLISLPRAIFFTVASYIFCSFLGLRICIFKHSHANRVTHTVTDKVRLMVFWDLDFLCYVYLFQLI